VSLVLFLRYNFLFCLFLFIGLSPFTIFLTKFSLWSIVLDLYSRLSLNLYFINVFHFFWTSLWYLYLFFVYLIFVNNFFNLKYSLWLINYIFILFYFINFSLFTDIYFDNTFNSHILLNSESSNVLLKNSVNKIHPFLLYSATMLFFIPWFYSLNVFNNRMLGRASFLTSFIMRDVKKSVIYILIALYLGSWWALQEGSWGGWWNWDASEFLGLLILYLVLTIFHSKSNLNSTHNLVNSLYLGLS
jgi:cytochrome c biogenesis factor